MVYSASSGPSGLGALVITVENLSKSFPSNSTPIVALHDVSLGIEAGALYGVVGSSGAGKSTLARCVSLQDRPDRGVVRLDGVNTGTLEPKKLRELRRQVRAVQPDEPLHGERTVAGNIAAPLEQLGFAGPQRRKRVADLLDLAGLTPSANHRPGALTDGQRRRVSLARAMATAPSVLLADDPTASVTPDEAPAVLSLLDRARAELGATVMLTTSEASVVRRVCDDVAVLERGTVLEDGKVLDLVTDPSSATARAILPAIETTGSAAGRYDRIADVVLVGFAAVGALLPEAAARFDTELSTIGGGLVRIGDTPVARFRLGARGAHADAALAWVGEQGGHVAHQVRGPQGLAA